MRGACRTVRGSVMRQYLTLWLRFFSPPLRPFLNEEIDQCSAAVAGLTETVTLDSHRWPWFTRTSARSLTVRVNRTMGLRNARKKLTHTTYYSYSACGRRNRPPFSVVVCNTKFEARNEPFSPNASGWHKNKRSLLGRTLHCHSSSSDADSLWTTVSNLKSTCFDSIHTEGGAGTIKLSQGGDPERQQDAASRLLVWRSTPLIDSYLATSYVLRRRTC